MPIYQATIVVSDTPTPFSEFYDNPSGEANEYAYLYLDSSEGGVIVVGNEDIDLPNDVGLPIITDCWHPITFLNNQEDFYLQSDTAAPGVPLRYLVKTKGTR